MQWYTIMVCMQWYGMVCNGIGMHWYWYEMVCNGIWYVKMVCYGMHWYWHWYAMVCNGTLTSWFVTLSDSSYPNFFP
jgi:hypothetical protein